MNKKDMIFIGVILAIALSAILIMNVMQDKNGTQVVITEDGQVYGTYDLNKDKVIYIETDEGTNTVKIADGSVSMIEASCPDQICVHSFPLSQDQPGIIVCLPHKIVVEIK